MEQNLIWILDNYLLVKFDLKLKLLAKKFSLSDNESMMVALKSSMGVIKLPYS